MLPGIDGFSDRLIGSALVVLGVNKGETDAATGSWRAIRAVLALVG
jgi:hypothetical protein